MRPIIIHSPEFCDVTGGIIVLHKLASELYRHIESLKLEIPVLISYWDGQDHNSYYQNIPSLASNSEINPKESIVIYPETTNGNPLESDQVVRYLLNEAGKLGGPQNFIDSDFVISQHPMFSMKTHPDAMIVCIHELFTDKIYPPALKFDDRAFPGYYTMRKGDRKKPKGGEISGLIDLPGHSSNPHSFGEIMRESKRFVSYDAATFLSVQAAMCGTLSIVIPDEKDPPPEVWKKMFPVGIAYGMQDIDHAIKTLDNIDRWLYEFNLQTTKHADALLDELINRFM